MSQIKAVLPVLMIPKTMNINLGYKLWHYEFACKCTFDDCTYTIVAQDLISGWNMIRKTADQPLRVNSGYRCQRHNGSDAVKGVKTSRHKSGHAIDIYTGALEEENKKEVIAVARKAFDIVVVYPSFIHCHMEPDKNHRVFVGHIEEEK